MRNCLLTTVGQHVHLIWPATEERIGPKNASMESRNSGSFYVKCHGIAASYQTPAENAAGKKRDTHRIPSLIESRCWGVSRIPCPKLPDHHIIWINLICFFSWMMLDMFEPVTCASSLGREPCSGLMNKWAQMKDVTWDWLTSLLICVASYVYAAQTVAPVGTTNGVAAIAVLGKIRIVASCAGWTGELAWEQPPAEAE